MIPEDNLKLAPFIAGGKDKDSVPRSVAAAVKEQVREHRSHMKIDPVRNWAMYMGEHKRYFKKRKNEDDETFDYRKKNAVIANYCAYVVNIAAKFLYGRASKVSRRFGDAKDTDLRMRKMLRNCDYDNLMLEAKKRAGVFGEVGFRNVAIDEKTLDQPDGIATPTTYAHPLLLDPAKSYFLTNQWNKVVAVVIEGETKDWTTGVKKQTLELVVEDSRWFWIDGVLDRAEANTYSLSEEFILAKNNNFGIDDLQDILDLNIKLDEALTDNAYFFAKHGWPQLVTSVDLTNAISAPGRAWEIPSEAPGDDIQKKVFFLTWDGRMEDSAKHIGYLEALIFKLSSTARIATGDIEAIGQLRSGPAIVTAHSPSIQKTQECQVVWGSNETKLLFAMAAFDSRLHNADTDKRYPGLEIDIVFPRDFVPGEELVRSEVQAQQANSHIRTFEDLIRENHPHFTDEQVEKYRDQLIKDSTELSDSTREFKTEEAPKASGQSGSASRKASEQTTASE